MTSAGAEWRENMTDDAARAKYVRAQAELVRLEGRAS